jgi:cytochrome c
MKGDKLFACSCGGPAAAAGTATVTTISYNFPKPGGTDPVAKEAYVTAVGNQGCGVGYYK